MQTHVKRQFQAGLNPISPRNTLCIFCWCHFTILLISRSSSSTAAAACLYLTRLRPPRDLCRLCYAHCYALGGHPPQDGKRLDRLRQKLGVVPRFISYILNIIYGVYMYIITHISCESSSRTCRIGWMPHLHPFPAMGFIVTLWAVKNLESHVHSIFSENCFSFGMLKLLPKLATYFLGSCSWFLTNACHPDLEFPCEGFSFPIVWHLLAGPDLNIAFKCVRHNRQIFISDRSEGEGTN